MLRSCFALVALVLWGCSGPSAPDPIEPALRVHWGLMDPEGTLPSGVREIRVRAYSDNAIPTDDCSAHCVEASFTVSALPSVDGGRPYLSWSLPRDHGPYRILLAGYDAPSTSGGVIRWVGQAGPLLLGVGERHYVDVQMYGVGMAQALPSAGLAGRFLHTATMLPDGRVLIAGGFTSVSNMATCPLEVPVGSFCVSATASNEAWVFDPTSGTATRLRMSMMASRAGHTATMLPDGRVLIAGGADRAVLAWVPQVPGQTFELQIFPDGVHASFEVFDAYLNGETEDANRDGDLGRGAFLGNASTPSAGPGPLNAPRFMHAAASVPSAPDHVLLAGGIASPGSYEVFDAHRAGGFGVYQGPTNVLDPARRLPSAIGMGNRVWIFGGLDVTADVELASMWSAADASAPNGTMVDPSLSTMFPHAGGDTMTAHPAYALMRPAVAPIGASNALALGWYGPTCDPVDLTAPSFDVTATVRCRAGTRARSFTVNGDSGLTVPTQVTPPRAFATGTVLDDGTVVFSGGIADGTWVVVPAKVVFSGAVTAAGDAMSSGDVPAGGTGRFFHTLTSLMDRGIVDIGGITFDASAGNAVLVQTAGASIEISFLPHH